MQETHTKIEMAMSALTDGRQPNKKAVHWAQKLANRKLKMYAFLDLGQHPEQLQEDKQDLEDTGEFSRKTFMFPDRCTGKAAIGYSWLESCF